MSVCTARLLIREDLGQATALSDNRFSWKLLAVAADTPPLSIWFDVVAVNEGARIDDDGWPISADLHQPVDYRRKWRYRCLAF
ncbi:MAG: hypothetical protein WB239_09310 [Acidimicrobiia bacterium]